jgi:uncharacterized protein YdeI (BOF family)
MRKRVTFLLLFFVWNLVVAKSTHLGCVYPAGAQQGKTVIAVISGDYLKKITGVDVFPSEGIEIEVIGSTFNNLNFNKVERNILKDKLRLLWEEKKKTATKELLNKVRAVDGDFLNDLKDKRHKDSKEFICPKCNDPLCLGCSTEKNESLAFANAVVWNVRDANFIQLIHIKNYLFNYRPKLQRNRQLGQSVVVKIKVSATAKIGLREIRVNTKSGLTLPLCFMINSLPEVNELEPNDTRESLTKYSSISPAPYSVPVIINGTIMPGDVDRFRFRLEKGEEINVEIEARKLNPYLADSVPGWFQAVGIIYDQNGHELKYCDDYLFYPDPLFSFTAPYSGEFQFEIRDAIYRGREDFVYRIILSKRERITSVYPLTVSEQCKKIKVDGLGIINNTIEINHNLNGLHPYRRIEVNNYAAYNISHLPIITEGKDNNTIKTAKSIHLPVIINGRIEKERDCDTYRFRAKKGNILVFDVSARSLGSPLDSFIRIIDCNGKVIATNDDFVQKEKFLHESETGLITHHADSYLMQKMPYSGEYFIQILDTQQNGGKNYSYSLRVSKPIPHFKTIITPSTINIKRNGMAPLRAYIIRKDGFTGAVKLDLLNNKDNFELINNTIPQNRFSADLILKAPRTKLKKPLSISFQSSSADGEIVSEVFPADLQMQAFLYKHLVRRKTTRVNQLKYFAPKINYKILETKPLITKVDNHHAIDIKLEFQSKKVVDFLHIELYKAPSWLKLKNIKKEKTIIELQLLFDQKLFNQKLTEFNIVLYLKKKLLHQKQKRKLGDIGTYIPITLKLEKSSWVLECTNKIPR